MTLDTNLFPRQFNNRKGFVDFLGHLMQLTEEDKNGDNRGKQAELKTYIMESNNVENKI